MSFDILPTEVLQIIFNFTTLNDLKTICLVCKRWAAAVEPLLSARTYLKLYQRVEPKPPLDLSYGSTYKESSVIDKTLLVNSNRSYTSLKVEWGNEITEPNQRALREVLGMCQERFPVQKIYLQASLGKGLADVLNNNPKLLENLTELHCEQYGSLYEQRSALRSELSLPNLKKLAWHEDEPAFYYSSQNEGYTFSPILRENFYRASPRVGIDKLIVTLHVPELDQLKVRIKTRSDTNGVDYLGLKQANKYCFFLPSLTLISCSKLKHVEISELAYLKQSISDHSATVLQNLKSLTLTSCSYQAIEKLCEKCSKLEELSIDTIFGSNVWQNFSIIPRSLKKLSLIRISICFSEEVAFPELCYLRLIGTFAIRNPNKLSLNAPKLTTVIMPQSSCLEVVHREQIHNMVIELTSLDSVDSPTAANVMEHNLYLRIITNYDRYREIVPSCLKHYPNLKRLTVFRTHGRAQSGAIALKLTIYPNLEYLCADGVAVSLDDFHELTHLKTLVLSDCVLQSTPGAAEEVVLSELQYIRVRMVVMLNETCDDHASYHFPICGGGDVRLPPVPVIKLSQGILVPLATMDSIS